jgi:hypothetical protein
MKKFENKETEFTENGEQLGFADMAMHCLDNPPKDGWEPRTMKLSFVVESKLEKAEIGDVIDLEDAEFDYLYLRSQPENMRWALKHKAIIDYSEYLDEVKKSN